MKGSSTRNIPGLPSAPCRRDARWLSGSRRSSRLLDVLPARHPRDVADTQSSMEKIETGCRLAASSKSAGSRLPSSNWRQWKRPAVVVEGHAGIPVGEPIGELRVEPVADEAVLGHPAVVGVEPVDDEVDAAALEAPDKRRPRRLSG